MSEYHTREAFEERMRVRRADPREPSPVAFFYHVACMGDWRDVVAEQLRLCAHAGVPEVRCAVLGGERDAALVETEGRAWGVRARVLYRSSDLAECEGPALELLHAWAREHTDGAAVYLHTKGVSAPGDAVKRHWRRVMMREVVAQWRRNLRVLAVADLCGVSWMADPAYPHFCGNFFAARCDWVSHLRSPHAHRDSRPDFLWNGQSWKSRFYAESWVGSEPWHHVEPFHGMNRQMWTDEVKRLPVSVEGFSYP